MSFCNKIGLYCRFSGGKVTEVRGFGCLNDTQPCVVERGSKVKIEIDFTSPYNSLWAFVSVFGRTGNRFLPIYIPWYGVNRNGCHGYGIECPLVRDKKYTYNFNMTVPKDAPEFSTEYTWRVSNVWGMTIACYSMLLGVI